MKTRLIIPVLIGILLLGAVGAASANMYGSFIQGALTLGYDTDAVYDPETGILTPGFYTPMVYTPNADVDGDEMEVEFYESVISGTVAPGFHTPGSYDPETGILTPGVYTPAIYTPEGETPLVYTSGVVPPEPKTPEPWGYIPDREDRVLEVEEVPEAYSLREDLAGTDMPGPCIPRRSEP